MAEGDTVLSEVEHVYRGYENIEDKLNALGAQLKMLQGPGSRKAIEDPN